MTIAQRPEFKAFCVRMKGESFRKRAGMFFTYPVADGVTGLVGLNTATQGYPKSCGLLHPVIGVHHIAIQQECARLSNVEYHPYNPATVSTPLYLAMGLRHSSRWVITPDEAEATAVFDDLFDAIVTDGLRWMRAHVALDAVIEGIGEGLTSGSEYTLPVVLRRAGRPEEAIRSIEKYQQELAGTRSTAKEDLRVFAENFTRQMAEDDGDG